MQSERRRRFFLLVVAIGVLWLVAARIKDTDRVDWQAQYEQKLGQPIVQMNTAVLNTPFQDGRGNRNRLSWARLQDGSDLLLGLPEYGLPAEQIVEETAVLEAQDARDFCEQAVGGKIYSLEWSWPDTTVGNTFVMHLGTKEEHGSVIIHGPDEPSCEIVYIQKGWQLRLVYNKGIVRAVQRP